MVNGCGKKIENSRTVVISKDGTVLYRKKTQKSIQEVMDELGIMRPSPI